MYEEKFDKYNVVKEPYISALEPRFTHINPDVSINANPVIQLFPNKRNGWLFAPIFL